MTASQAEVLIEEIEGPIAQIVFNRPDHLNAFNADLRDAYDSALDRYEHDDSVRVVILRGQGRAFSVGGDISGTGRSGYEAKAHDILADYESLRRNLERWLRVFYYPKPVIAQVHGYAAGLGAVLAACCDITVVSLDCKIRMASLEIGAGVNSSPMAGLIGWKKAKEIDFCMNGELTGQEAYEWGWANRAVPEADLAATVMAMARRIALYSPELMRLKKASLNKLAEAQGFPDAVRHGAHIDAIARGSSVCKDAYAEIREIGLSAALKKMKAAVEQADRPS